MTDLDIFESVKTTPKRPKLIHGQFLFLFFSDREMITGGVPLTAHHFSECIGILIPISKFSNVARLP